MEKDVYKYYLQDICSELKDKAATAKRERDDEYSKGYALALYEVVSLLQQQANSFQIPLEEINLADINPEKDLL